MADLETRIISGKGILKLDVDSDDFKKAKIIIVYADVIRQPRNKYLNNNWNPPKSRYATFNFMRDTYVIKSHAMEFPSEKIEFYPDPAAQAMLAVDCAYRGILESFVNLETALALPVISVINNIKDWKWQDLYFDEIKVVCYGDTAIQLNVQSIPYELCPDQTEHTRNPPPPPAPIPDPIPPGTPLSDLNTPVSPPYEGDDDGGDTIPYPDDTSPGEPPDTPFGEDGQRFTISFTYDRIRGGTLYDTQSVSFVAVRAPIQDYGISDDMTPYGSAAPGAYVIGTNANGTPNYNTNGLGFVGFSTCANLRDVVITEV